MVLAVCRRLLRRSDDVEDAFQATFLVLSRRASSIDRPQQLASWLYGVAYRTALKARSLIARRHARELPFGDTDHIAPSDPVWHDITALLDEEINRLPHKYRNAFILCYLQGMTTAEAGKELHCPRGTVLSRLAWARERLCNRLTSRGVAISSVVLTTALTDRACCAPSFALLEATRSAVLAFTTNTPVAIGVATPAALATGVLRSMTLIKYKLVALSLLALAPIAIPLGVINKPGAGVMAAIHAPADPPQAEETRVESGTPKGWRLVTSRSEEFSGGLDHKVFHGGKASAYFALAQGGDDDVARLNPAREAEPLAVVVVRLDELCHVDDVRVATFPWMRIDSKEAVLQCDDHSKRTPVKDTQDWKQFAIVLDVDKNAANLVLGFTLKGKGRVWVDDFKLEVVDEKVILTNQLEAVVRFGAGHEVEQGLEKPTNLDFEELADEPENPAAWVSYSSRKGTKTPTLAIVFEGKKSEPKEYPADADVTVISYLADKPWGHMKWLALDLADRNRMLLHFEPKLEGKVVKAELVLHFDAGIGEHPTPKRPFEISIHEVKEAWEEDTVTWEKQPSFVEKAAVTVPIDPKAKEVRVDITGLVQRLTEKDALRHGWLLKVAKPLKVENP
jgi:RNA polymerase sigma factor (sigma-70 family)